MVTAAVQAQPKAAQEVLLPSTWLPDEAHIDRAARLRLGEWFEFETGVIIVRRADGNDAELNTWQVGLEQTVGDFVDRAVAPGGGDDSKAGVGRLGGKLLSMAGVFGGLEGGPAGPTLSKPREPPRRLPAAGPGIENHAYIRLGHPAVP